MAAITEDHRLTETTAGVLGGDGYHVLHRTTTTNNHSGTEDNGSLNGDGEGGAGEPQLTLDIIINNVVCSFNVRCHLDLRKIALNAINVEYRRENGMVTMKIRKPNATASLWSSGKITCTGATSEDLAKVAARRFARLLQKLGFKTRFTNYRVVNVLGTCTMPFAINIINFSRDNRSNASYEPELHPGVTYKIKEPKATMKIFSTGSITVTAPSVLNVQSAIEHIFPIVYEYRKERSKRCEESMHRKEKLNSRKEGKNDQKRRRIVRDKDDDDDDDDVEDTDSDNSGE